MASTEVGSWPLTSGIARRCGTIFLDRFRARALPEVVEQAALALRQGHKVQAFPEATTRCGWAVGEFYRCVFQAAIDAAVVVAPVTLRYLDGDGRPTPVPAFPETSRWPTRCAGYWRCVASRCSGRSPGIWRSRWCSAPGERC